MEKLMKLKELTLKEDDLCFKYSNNPEKLKELLKDIKITVTSKGIKKHFATDTEERLILNVSIKRHMVINFDFGCSLYDTEIFKDYSGTQYYDYHGKRYFDFNKVREMVKSDRIKFYDGLLYHILCSCKSDYYVPVSFGEFCSEFAYNNDSIKDRDLFLECLELKARLNKIFTEDEINCLPS